MPLEPLGRDTAAACRSPADVDRALTEERTLLITWLKRGTPHLVSREDYPWLQALTTPPLFSGNARRLAQEGVTPRLAERGVTAIARPLADERPITRRQLRERLAAAGIPTRGQALVRLLMPASLRGIAVRGPMVGRDHAYALVRGWLGESAQGDDRLARAVAPLVASVEGVLASLPLLEARVGADQVVASSSSEGPWATTSTPSAPALAATPLRRAGGRPPDLGLSLYVLMSMIPVIDPPRGAAAARAAATGRVGRRPATEA